jgi:hypothetical protein
VIDESRIVAIRPGIDHDILIDREQERVMVLAFDAGSRLAAFRFVRRDPLASILDEPRSGRNVLRGKRTETVHRRPANLERWRQPDTACVSTFVTPPEMMNAITAVASASIRSTRVAGTKTMCPANPYDCGMYTLT